MTDGFDICPHCNQPALPRLVPDSRFTAVACRRCFKVVEQPPRTSEPEQRGPSSPTPEKQP